MRDSRLTIVSTSNLLGGCFPHIVPRELGGDGEEARGENAYVHGAYKY